MRISSWIFLKDGKPAFTCPPPFQKGWLTDVGTVQHVWRRLRNAGFNYLETRSLNQDPLENTFGVIHLHCGANNNPIVGEFVDVLNNSIIDGFVYAGLRNANCEGDDTELLDNLHSFLKGSCASQPNPSTNDGSEPLLDSVSGSYIAEPVQQYVSDINSDLFSIAYVSGFIAKRATCCEV
jgi:hypothetical protein